LKGIIILNLDKNSELHIDSEHPQNICEELGVTESMLKTVFEEHKKIRAGPNYLEMQIKRDLSVASFFTGHSSKHFIGKGDHAITVFLSDKDILPKNFEGQVRRIAFELLPKRKDKKFKDLFATSFSLLEKGELDAYWQEKQELEQVLIEKKEKIDDLAQKVSMLVSDRTDHLRNVQALKDEINSLYTKMDNWSVQMAELNEYNANLTMKVKEYNELIEHQKKEIAQKGEEITKLNRIIEDKQEIEDGAVKLLAQIKQVKTEKEALTNEIEKANETNKKLKFQILKVTRENEDHLDSINNLKIENKQLKDNLMGTTNEKENLKREMIDLKKEVKVLRRDRDHYQQIMKDNNLL